MNAELVQKVVEQVIAALAARDPAAPLPGPGGEPSAGHRRPVAAEKPSSVPPSPSAGTASPNHARTFLTYDALTRRLADGKAGGGTIELAHNEFLTPAARDLAEQRNLAVHRLPPPDATPRGPAASPTATPGGPSGNSPQGNPNPSPSGHLRAPGEPATGPLLAPAATGSIGLVVDRANEKVRGLVDSLYRDGLSLADFNLDACWMSNLRSMCEAIAGGRLPAGVAILPYAPDAMVLANKIRSIRAVQGASRQSVSAALRHFGANVLIVEYAVSTFHEMRSMIRAFAGERGRGGAATALLAALAEVEGL